MPKINNRIKSDLKDILLDPPKGISAAPKRQHHGYRLHHWIASIDGPADSVYQGGRFYFDINFPKIIHFHHQKSNVKQRIERCIIAIFHQMVIYV